MKWRLVLTFLPLILAVSLNPLMILYVYEKISLEGPSDALILVNGLRSELKAKSGDEISADLSYTLTENTTLRVQKLSNTILEIDHRIINGSEVTLGPGKHQIRYMATMPEVNFPEKREILLLQPISTSENGLILTLFILPRNWDLTLLMLSPVGALTVLVGGFGTFLSLMNLREMKKFKAKQGEERRLEQEYRLLQRNMGALKGKVVNLVDLVSDLTISYNIPEDELLEKVRNYSFARTEDPEEVSQVEADPPKMEEKTTLNSKPIRVVIRRMLRREN